MSSAIGVARREAWLDFAIVAAFLVVPHSFLLWVSSSEFGVPPVKRAPLFLIPAVLLALKLTGVRRRQRSMVDPVVVFLWLGVVLQGLVMGLSSTEYPVNVLSVYGQYLYWLALVGVFVGSVRQQSPVYVFELMRRYFIAVAVVAWAFVALYFVFGEQLPHRVVLQPQASGADLLVGHNYYVTMAYSSYSFLGRAIPRFSFLYREPRILGMQLVMGIILQVGHLREHWRFWARRERRRNLLALGLMLGAIYWTHSVNGYVFASFMALGLAVAAIMRRRFWRNFRALHLAALGVGVGLLAAGFIVIGSRRDLAALVEIAVAQNYVGEPAAEGTTLYEVVDKPPEFVASYLTAYLRSPAALVLFPLGTGIMNLDSERYMSRFGVPTTQGGTLVQFFAQNAGFVGLAVFCIIAWRLLGRMKRLASGTWSYEVRYACLLAGFLLVVSTVYVDIISTSAFAPLVFGSLMNLRPET